MGWSLGNDNFYQNLMGYQKASQAAFGAAFGQGASNPAVNGNVGSATNPWAGQQVDSFTYTGIPTGTPGGPNIQALLANPFAYQPLDTQMKYASIQKSVSSVLGGPGETQSFVNNILSSPGMTQATPSGEKAETGDSSDSSIPPSKGKLSGAVPAKVRRWEPYIMEAAKKYGIPPEMIAAVITQESGGNPNAGSSAGARGLMQFMSGTFASVKNRYDIKGSITDPKANIYAGAAHLKELHKKYKSWEKALAAYNAGGGAVDKYNGIPPFKETQRYVPSVLAHYKKYSAG